MRVQSVGLYDKKVDKILTSLHGGLKMEGGGSDSSFFARRCDDSEDFNSPCCFRAVIDGARDA